MNRRVRQEEMEGHRRETEAQGERRGERAFPGSPGASTPNPGVPTPPNSHPTLNPPCNSPRRGAGARKAAVGPQTQTQRPGARGTALPWRRRARFRQRVSRVGPSSRGRRGRGLVPGRAGRSPVTVSLERDRRGPCDPGRCRDWVAGKVKAQP